MKLRMLTLFFLGSFYVLHGGQNGVAPCTYHTSSFDAIGTVLKKFKRRITVLEIGRGKADYTCAIAQLYNTACIALLIDSGSQELIERIHATKASNITVLAPARLSYESLFTLGRCEHFDVVIVHDIGEAINAPLGKLVDAFIKLGDYVFIESSQGPLRNELQKKKIPLLHTQEQTGLYLSYKPKTSLDIARFTQKHRPLNPHPKYHIKSNLQRKYFQKKDAAHPVKWVDGINLVTFALLSGVYPEDYQIRRQLITMKKTHPDHNDLVLGNIIVQGQKLIPIDCNDARRDADMDRCLTAALGAFKEGNDRHKNPEKWIHDYYDRV